MSQQRSVNALIRTYKSSLKGTKLGIFLGAGTSMKSKIPNFKDFAFKSFQAAFDDDLRFRRQISFRFKDYIELQSKLSKPDINPEELFTIIKKYFRTDLDRNSEEWKKAWLHFCAEQLYEDANKPAKKSKQEEEVLLQGRKTDWRIHKSLYENNTSLKSIISFCLAQSADFVDPAIKSYLDSSKFQHKMGWNPRIGGVVTTNYDDLFEATINHKFSRTKGTEYGSRPVFEGRKHMNRFHLLEVQHIHGFLTHDTNYYLRTNKKRLIDIIATEVDFFKTFYESMSFSNYAGMRFFDQFHLLFIGCTMKDKNIRRFLYHLQESQHYETEKFAILRCNCSKHQHEKQTDTFSPDCLDNSNIFTEELLKTYGIHVIWVCNYSQIPIILKEVYEGAGGDWAKVYDGMW